MPSTIQLRKGDMFARPTDLVIIPCSTAGTIASSVAEQLKTFDIRPPRGYMELGDVKFELFEGASNISTYVGYAASVEAMTSNTTAITRIAERIANFAKDKSEIRDIALPLLGSAAGGLSPESSADALKKGFERIPSDGKVFNIFVYKGADFDVLSRIFGRPLKSTIPEGTGRPGARRREPIRVFISYTKTNVQHQEWVRDLARYLRDKGVDARLDIWHLRPGMDLPQWMCNEIDLADRIIIVCNEDYSLKADGRRGGVGWEIRLIQGDLLHSQSANPRKYIPVVASTPNQENMPKFLLGVYALDLSEKHGKKRLLDEIYEVYEEAPPLGEPPRYVLG